MRDFLVFYNNRDVVPFLECIDQQFAFYQQQNIDMFEDGISVPGLTLLYLFNDLPPNTFFTVFNQTNKDLHHLVKDNIVGGPAIIFHRYHEKNVTKIRAGEMCRSVVGYDANALYLWALMQDMPCGWYTRRREENTKKNTAYLRRHVHVVEMWECEWKREAKQPRHPKWTMTQNEILTAVIDGALFGMVECDVHVPDNLRGHFAEMQPVFKNTAVTRDDIGPYMRQYA